MNTKEILSHVDHTLLKATATWEQIQKIAEESIEYGTASICIPQCYLKRLNEKYGDKVNLCTVVGFPLGYNSTSSKVEEVKSALADGANEIDMVVNIADVKNKDYKKVEDEIRALKEACGDHILKVIIETCYLDEEEKIAMCHAVTNAGAEYIKTSTGFGTAGATMEDILLFKKHIGPNVKMKAAGGIRSVKDMEDYLAVGVDRLGTSSAIKLIEGEKTSGY
ncbi:MAG: deoxyribose-phosphate aldolase [Erysipelotrichaceae bacterium]|nr:deoxyribose-phosphate aldolase [Erysipelotrichaceae bacterium]MBQ4343541.1 deoxyribose-phosphate aldolase [Erysipelotrichaceae bacterium]